MIPRSGLQKNHDLVLERCVLAAVRMNDRAFGCTTGPDILLTRHFLRCMRVQYEVTMAVLGSVPPNDYRFCRAASGWRTAQAARHLGLDVDPFSDTQRIFKFHAQVTHRAIDLGVAEQQLHCAEVSSLPVNLRRFGTSQ